MSSSTNNQGKFSTAAGRWAGVGPYYAMFPSAFADKVIQDYSRPGDLVLDPFAGRGTSVFSAASLGRNGIGIDINPLGYVYSKAKIQTASFEKVTNRLEQLIENKNQFTLDAENMSDFFHICYSKDVLKFLLAARSLLNWRKNKTDNTLMSLILVYLHGKIGQSLSNQMRHSTAMSPRYSVDWWNKERLHPPEIDVHDFFIKRLKWRYKHGIPDTAKSYCYLNDSRSKLASMNRKADSERLAKVNLLLTSPPYHNIINYYEDQWIRLWLLGLPDSPDMAQSRNLGCKFRSCAKHFKLLDDIFSASKGLLSEDATIYVRTDKREVTYKNTLLALEKNFPEKRLEKQEKPLPPDKQLKAYSRGGAPKNHNCEVDIILTPR